MTPESWPWIDDLFDAALRLAPAEREPWLRDACGGDEGLRAEVGRLLAGDEWAGRNGFLTPPGEAGPSADRTESWQPRAGVLPSQEAGTADDAGDSTPRPAIAPQAGRCRISEPPDIVRARLRELPIGFLLIVAVSAVWMRAVFGQESPTFYRVCALVMLALVGLMVPLWSRWPIPLAGLKSLELGMVVLLAVLVAFGQYRWMLAYSLRGDTMMAMMTLRSVVLLTAVLILAYGLYVPKSWRRAAIVAGPLALLPFATLGVMALRHPAAMAWLREAWGAGAIPLALLVTYDGLILIILAVGATFGARTMSRLRREVARAWQLGRYHLRERIGAGGMGEVYLAEHRLLKRPCAVKLIRPDVVADTNAQARFEREVQITASLSHPNIVEVYDYGRAEDGTYYYVMEFLDGLSLEELVRRHGPLPPGRVVYLLRQVCQALRVAHAAGLIHRDIKPSNIIAARRSGMDDVAKLLDFGLVLCRAGPPTPHLTGEGQVLGTPSFMSPEQVMSGCRVVDERSDLYALGAVAYDLLAGRPPFGEGDGIMVMIAHARDPVVPPSRGRAAVPEDLECVVLRCLAKDPAERFPDAESLEGALGMCSCAGEWGQEQASRWWHDASRSASATLGDH